MEPMNTTVHVRDDEIEVWSPTQFADEVQDEIAQLSGFSIDKVTVHMTLSGRILRPALSVGLTPPRHGRSQRK